MTLKTPTTLEELRDAMINASLDEWEAMGLPVAHGRPDWTSLPTFGGVEPEETTGIWSWDAVHLIVGTCAADLKVVNRDEWGDGEDL